METIEAWIRSSFSIATTALKSWVMTLVEIAGDAFEAVRAFLDTSLGTTIIGTAVAAFAGAFGAHVIAERGKRQEALRRELRITSSAITMTFEICNSFISLKDQHVRRLKQHYDAARQSVEEFEKKRKAGKLPPGAEFAPQMDLMALESMVVPHEILVRQVYEQISAKARTQALISVLIRTVDSLNRSIEQRNLLIRAYRDAKQGWPGGVSSFYFGHPDNDGHVDLSYPQSIDAIAALTDDCIWFSSTICRDLQQHGESLQSLIGTRARKIPKPDFKKAEEKGLMPNDQVYSDWNWG